ncbi:uncharacterized protein LOC129768398 [Toxorhynchites rutilus septentrionalis]|uniref:uncharacterized protein LOC129768398 n=1 Tax=Toxorhynchites rutilus septentrionalis TaxID=329112 RepID=UPI0024792B1A|nr:uncharacterized protein LOC129768398 [Toxorhynchites rutilus septentrionalis]
MTTGIHSMARFDVSFEGTVGNCLFLFPIGFLTMRRSVQDFWNRWSRDYVSQLHQRSKWKRATTNIQVGALALLKQSNLPPFLWNLGRIVETYADQDRLVRVVLVRTSHGHYKRAVTEISVLPIDATDAANTEDQQPTDEQLPKQ